MTGVSNIAMQEEYDAQAERDTEKIGVKVEYTVTLTVYAEDRAQADKLATSFCDEADGIMDFTLVEAAEPTEVPIIKAQA